MAKHKFKLRTEQTNSKGSDVLHAYIDRDSDKELRLSWRLKFGAVTTTFIVYNRLGEPGKRYAYEGNSLSQALEVYNSI